MGIRQSIYSISTLLIALFCVHVPRYRAPFFVVVFHVSVAEPPDVLVAVLPAVEAAAEVPAAGDNLVALAEGVSSFLSLYCGCLLG